MAKREPSVDDETLENEYEIERQKTIAENKALLEQLGFEEGGDARIALPKAKPKPERKATEKKRKEPPTTEGPRRRSARVAGLEADGVELAVKQEQELVQAEERRVRDRKLREQVMDLSAMVEDSPAPVGELETLLPTLQGGRVFPSAKESAVYDDSDTAPAEVERLKAAFEGMVLRAQEKVTSERVYSIAVHPDREKTVVFVGDKNGELGIWDALGPPMEGEEDGGRIWRVQAHARNAISCMKIDPVDGKSLVTSAYDCSLRRLDFATLKSTEVFAFDNEDMLVSHFDLTPSGQDAWISDTLGGISHCDFREGGERRRWVVQDEGRTAKLGGISINPLMPHLICTASNDRHLRIWDVRHLSKIKPVAAESLEPPKAEDGVERIATNPTSSVTYERTLDYRDSKKGKGLLRASFEHGKSCSAAYWDPFGRRILTTSYDDKLRVWSLNPQSFLLDAPLAPTHFKPIKALPHDCQTGRWLTILRAQWSMNTEYMPHFTVGNMKRTLDVVAATGDRIVKLWADGVTAVPCVTASHPSIVNHVVGGNSSGRIQLWTRGE